MLQNLSICSECLVLGSKTPAPVPSADLDPSVYHFKVAFAGPLIFRTQFRDEVFGETVFLDHVIFGDLQ